MSLPSMGLGRALCADQALQEEARIASVKDLKGQGFILKLHSPKLAPKIKPGQFVHLDLPGDFFLRRPYSVMDAQASSLWVYGRQVGRGSRELSGFSRGARLNIMGPLGYPFDISRFGPKTLLVAGGTGAGVVFLLAKRLGGRGLKPRFLYGAKTRDELSLRGELKKLKGVDLSLSTDDGSMGQKGTVLGLLKRHGPRSESVVACGPVPMMEAVYGQSRAMGLECWVSLEQRMGCAVGACYACAFPMKGQKGYETYVRVCRQGTIFKGEDIDWKKARQAVRPPSFQAA